MNTRVSWGRNSPFWGETENVELGAGADGEEESDEDDDDEERIALEGDAAREVVGVSDQEKGRGRGVELVRVICLVEQPLIVKLSNTMLSTVSPDFSSVDDDAAAEAEEVAVSERGATEDVVAEETG